MQGGNAPIAAAATHKLCNFQYWPQTFPFNTLLRGKWQAKAFRTEWKCVLESFSTGNSNLPSRQPLPLPPCSRHPVIRALIGVGGGGGGVAVALHSYTFFHLDSMVKYLKSCQITPLHMSPSSTQSSPRIPSHTLTHSKSIQKNIVIRVVFGILLHWKNYILFQEEIFFAFYFIFCFLPFPLIFIFLFSIFNFISYIFFKYKMGGKWKTEKRICIYNAMANARSSGK